MVVEFLTFEVENAELDEWLRVEESTWTAFLGQVAGFVRKQVWREPDDAGRVHVVIWWESRDAWKAVTPEQIAAVDAGMGRWYREPSEREFVVLRLG